MKYFGCFLLFVAAVVVVIAQQLNINNINNFESEQVRNTINSIIETFKQYEQYGGFIDAKVVLKDGYIDSVRAVSICENEAMNAFSTGEELFLQNQQSAAIKAIQQGIEAAENLLYDAGVKALQCLGDALTLSNENAREGLSEASQMVQTFGMDLVFQMEISKNSASQGISAGGGTAKQAINAARQGLQSVFVLLYDVAQDSHRLATKSVNDAQSTTAHQYQIVNQYAEVGARDPHASTLISEITKAAESSIKKGASAERVNQLKQYLISLVCDFAQIAVETREYFEYIAKLAETDPLSAEDLLRKEARKFKQQIQKTISNVFLGFSSGNVNSDILTRTQLGRSIKTFELGNVEITSENKIALDLAIMGFGLPASVRALVLRAAVESARYGKIALFNRLLDAAGNAFNTL